ncbi:MAG: LytTR family DNA-binding domain-containing protein [Caulobacteraceae bacterium]
MAGSNGGGEDGKLPASAAARTSPGTVGGAVGTNGGRSGANGWFSGTNGDTLIYAVAFAAVLAICTVNTFSKIADVAEAGVQLPLWLSALWEFSSGLVIFAELPAVFWLARRLPITRQKPWIWLGAHGLATIPFSVIHTLSMGAVRVPLYALMGRSYDFLTPFRDGIYEYRKDVLTYAASVAIYWTWRGYFMKQEAPAAPHAKDVPLEIRDGARRLYVKPSEIFWIEASANYARLHLQGREITHRASLSAMEAVLADDGFVRVHRSRLVNRAFVAGVKSLDSGDMTIALRDGREIGGSRRYRAALLED